MGIYQLNYQFKNENDKILASSTFTRLAYLIFGKNNDSEIEKFKKTFETYVKELDILNQTDTSNILEEQKSGTCYLLEKKQYPELTHNAIGITCRGIVGAVDQNTPMIIHGVFHEFTHAFSELLARQNAKYPDGITKNDIFICNNLGAIKETHKDGTEEKYGIMFCETMTDLISAMAYNTYSAPKGDKLDDILNEKYSKIEELDKTKTGYTFFISITQLAIAAFSNNGFISYDKLDKEEKRIFNSRINIGNNTVYTNDFLYGIIYDPMHIEEEFDKIMGTGEYKKLCKVLDELFLRWKNNQYETEEEMLNDIASEIKESLFIIPKFLSKRLKQLEDKTQSQERSKIASNLNKIWNDIQINYGAYLNKKDENENQ